MSQYYSDRNKGIKKRFLELKGKGMSATHAFMLMSEENLGTESNPCYISETSIRRIVYNVHNKKPAQKVIS